MTSTNLYLYILKSMFANKNITKNSESDIVKSILVVKF